jgi:hypothetical protein
MELKFRNFLEPQNGRDKGTHQGRVWIWRDVCGESGQIHHGMKRAGGILLKPDFANSILDNKTAL